MHWLEQLIGLVLIAATRDVAARAEIGPEWFRWFGRYVPGCAWPEGLWQLERHRIFAATRTEDCRVR